MPDSIAQRLADLPKLSKTVLRELWKEIFSTPPPPQLRRHLMIPILAYRLQEKGLGAMTAANRGRLGQLARAFETNSNSGVSSVPTLRPGTRLVRQWRDQVHLVNVGNSGYEYQGVRYQSLSEIARQITGTRWSGPAFFGLKQERTTQQKEIQ